MFLLLDRLAALAICDRFHSSGEGRKMAHEVFIAAALITMMGNVGLAVDVREPV